MIEIKELVIRTSIVEAPPAAPGPGAGELAPEVRQALLAECRQLVLDLLRERGER